MEIVNGCPMCGSTHWMRVSAEKYESWKYGGVLIQNAFPDLLPAEREFLISGYCPECQELLFGSKYEGTKIK